MVNILYIGHLKLKHGNLTTILLCFVASEVQLVDLFINIEMPILVNYKKIS